MQNSKLPIGVSFGRIASAQLWERQPIYVHQMIADATEKHDRNRLTRAIDKVLATSDLEQAWNAFFPALSVFVLGGPQQTPVALTAGVIERGNSWLLRTYTIPSIVKELIGEEVSSDLRYESIAPISLTSFHLLFPWLTYRCTAQVTIHGESEFLTYNYWVLSESSLKIRRETVQHREKVLITTKDLVLPNSSVEIRWQLKNNK